MSSISLSSLQSVFSRYDIDGNGALDRPEIAQSVLGLVGEGKKTEGSLLSTFVLGGNDRLGLFPDSNGDKQLSFSELTSLAAKAGDPNSIAVDDFQAAFPGRVATGGQNVTMQQLKDIAAGNTSKFNVNANNISGSANALGWLGAGNGQDMMQQFMMIFMMIKLFSK